MKYEITALRIREAMKDMNISQQELADKSKIGKSSISHYVNGSNEPNNKSAYALAKVLNVNPVWLMGLDVPKYENSELSDYDKAIELYKRFENLPPDRQKAFLDYLSFLQSQSSQP